MYVEEKLKAEILTEALEKVVRPSRRREMARRAVQDCGVSIRMACEAFSISHTCYRYVAKIDAENKEIADWLFRLTDNRPWGFGPCFLYLRNVPGFAWTISACTGSTASSN